MPEFIRIEIDRDKCIGISNAADASRYARSTSFQSRTMILVWLEHIRYECTLCDLCLKEAVKWQWLYEKLYEP